MNRHYLILVIVSFLFLSLKSGYSADNMSSGSDYAVQFYYQENHDLYIDQTLNVTGHTREMTGDADRFSTTADDSILTASFMKVSATTNTGVLLGILGGVLLVSGSITYWRMRKMNV